MVCTNMLRCDVARYRAAPGAPVALHSCHDAKPRRLTALFREVNKSLPCLFRESKRFIHPGGVSDHHHPTGDVQYCSKCPHFRDFFSGEKGGAGARLVKIKL
jgi:hypothetical protein